MEFNQFIILLVLISFTVWIWVKSLSATSCKSNLSDEYITLHQKYNKLLKEKNQLEMLARGYGKLPNENIMREDIFDNDMDDQDYDDIFD